MSKHASIEDAEASGKYIRRIRSFVKREGRLTKGQAARWNANGQNWD